MYEIKRATDLKRQNRIGEALKLYERLNENYPDHRHIYKGWAKTLAADGYFDKALELFRSASYLFNKNENQGEAWQCQVHAEKLAYFKNNGYDYNDIEFVQYIHSLSGAWERGIGFGDFKMPPQKSYTNI